MLAVLAPRRWSVKTCLQAHRERKLFMKVLSISEKLVEEELDTKKKPPSLFYATCVSSIGGKHVRERESGHCVIVCCESFASRQGKATRDEMKEAL